MKYYDNSGGTHGNIFAAMAKNVSNKADAFIRNKMPGYEEVINANEHLYDAIPIRFDSSIPEPIEEAIPEQTEVSNTEDNPSTGETRSEKMSNACMNTMGIKMEMPTPPYNYTEPSVQDLLKMDHEEPIPSLQKIHIDYAHSVINLYDANGEIIASSSIDERLSKGTIDKALLDVLYPDGDIPPAITTNIQSKGYIPGHVTKTSQSNQNDSVESVTIETSSQEDGFAQG